MTSIKKPSLHAVPKTCATTDLDRVILKSDTPVSLPPCRPCNLLFAYFELWHRSLGLVLLFLLFLRESRGKNIGHQNSLSFCTVYRYDQSADKIVYTPDCLEFRVQHPDVAWKE